MTCKISDFGKRITFECKAEFVPFMAANPQRSSSFSFASLCMWGDQYYKIFDGFLCVAGSDWIGLEFPGAYVGAPLSVDGQYDAKKLRTVLLKAKQELCPEGETVTLLGVPEVQLSLYNEALEGLSEPIEDRASWDYIYKRSDLAELAGRKYTVKRNHINNLKATWEYVYEPITPDCIGELEEALDDFLEQKIDADESGSLLEIEVEAVRNVLPIYEKVDMFGGFIRIDGKVKAFTLGNMMNDEMVDVAIEKADASVRGLYQAINQEFAKSLPPEVLYINREEDMGSKGLRQSKQSYHPCCMGKVYKYRF